MLRTSQAITLSVFFALTMACGEPTAPLYYPDPAFIVPVAFTPTDGETGVAGDIPLVVEMQDDIDGTRLGEATITVEQSDGTPVPILPPTYELRLITIEPDGSALASGVEHTVTVDGLYDTEGRVLDGFSWSFTTLVDNTGPSLINQLPKDTDTVVRNTSVFVQFDEPLDSGAVAQDWITVDDGAPVTGTVVYDPVGYTLEFRPSNLLTANATVTVTVSADIVDRFNNPVQGGELVFTFTAGDVDDVDTKSPTFDATAPTATYDGGLEGVTVDWPQAADAAVGTIPDLGADYIRYDVRVTGPDLSSAGQVLASSFGTLTADVPDLPQGTYTFFVEAIDVAGNRREFPCASVPMVEECPPRATSLAGALEFEKDIRPILEENCGRQNCHAGDTAPGFLDFTPEATYEELLNYVDPETGTPLIVPGDANVSYLYWKIADEERALRDLGPFPYEGSFMPPELFAPLSYADVIKIRTWISQGAAQ